ncbi:MAG TPA: hypothetical protein VLT62_05485 [Candidatus Methylomirabilis sp.]|nr:hypothetical protein [Candidatus Methylomirabilis sp.]
MKIRGRSRWVPPALLAAWLLGGAGCASLPPETAKLPLGVQVENPGHMRVAVVRATRRPLTAAELRPFEHGGFRWDYSVEFTDTAGTGVQFMVVEATVRSLTGISATTVTQLASRVEPLGTTPIQIHAILSSSNPDEPGNVSGVQELTFLGVDDRGESVRVIVRVPLE